MNKYNWTISILLIALVISSCNKERIKVSKTNNEFTELQVTNPFGSTVIFQAVDSMGAIGYTVNSDDHWLQGKPEVKVIDQHTTTYHWKNQQPEAIIKTTIEENDIHFEFNLQSTNQKPSAWMLNLSADEGEYYTGIFERVVDGSQNESWKPGIKTALNLRGERMDVRLKPTVSAYAPFYISSENYAFFGTGTWPGIIDFCKSNNRNVAIRFEGSSFSFSLMMDKTPAELVKRHALKTGPSLVPPKWSLGPWRWRDEHANNKNYYEGSLVKAPYNSNLVEDILMMEAYDIPCTAYWIDRPWGPGTRGFEDFKIDYERLPNFEAMIPWLNSKGIEIILWIAPWIMGDMAKTAEENNFDLISRVWGGNQGQVLIDFSNPEAVKWWGENGPAKLAKMGVKGFKLDRADGEKLVDSLHLYTTSGKTYRENFNNYAVEYVKATYEAVHPVLGNDFFIFPRAQYTGSAKYGAMWAGDTGNTPEGLRSALIALQRCAIMGYPIWGSDTGGYPKKMQRETTMRWLGFSCFSPVMEVGPTNNLGFWGMNYEPSFDKELLAIWRFYAKLRMSLVDYIHQCAVEASETGMPIARPLFLEYPNQKESWTDWQTYKLGNDLLISVIWEDGKTSHKLYLPAGETWIDLWSGKELQGGRFIEMKAALHQIPVFMRKNSNLKLPDLNELYNESVQLTSVKYSMSDLESKEGW